MTSTARQMKVGPSAETRALLRQPPDSAKTYSFLYWLLAGLIAILASIFYWKHSDPLGAGRYWDFENGYYATAKAVLHGGAPALTSHLSDGSFVNIPIVAWILLPIGLLNQTSADVAFAAISVACVLMSLLLLSRYGTSKTAAGLFLMFVLNGPLWYGLLFGNSTPIVLLCLVAALTLWKRQYGYSAGLLVGAAAVIKPMIILFGIYFVFKKEWRVVLGGATVIIGCILASVVVAGPEMMVYWYIHVVADLSGKPMPAYNVQSIESFILRLSDGPEYVSNINPHLLPAWGKFVRDLAFAFLLAFAGYGFWRGRARPQISVTGGVSAQDYLEFCVVLTLCLMISTVSWTHYYLLLLLPYSLYFTRQLPLRTDWPTRILMWTSLVFCSLPVHRYVFSSPWLEAVFYKSLQSFWLIGALLLFCALMASILSPGRAVPIAQRTI